MSVIALSFHKAQTRPRSPEPPRVRVVQNDAPPPPTAFPLEQMAQPPAGGGAIELRAIGHFSGEEAAMRVRMSTSPSRRQPTS